MTSTVITAAEYAAAARRVAGLTRDIDGASSTVWTLHDADATRPDRVYLSARRVLPASPSSANVTAALECVDDDSPVKTDDEVDANNHEPVPASSWLQWEIHVVYHATYACPALYFRGSALDGRVLDETAAVQALEHMRATSHMAAPVSTAMGPFASAVAAGLHPVLGTPFLYLHPCQTHALLASIAASAPGTPSRFTARALLAWLSAVGSVFGGLVSTAQWTAVAAGNDN
ncbi:E2-like conjugating enzyme atg10 [Allomyces arbusculus]|nr:E2-like conjugating enzyme atg10 [Allomyces arbusculus]